MSIDRARALKDAQKYLAKGQIDRAIIEYEKMVAADPSDARSLLKLGDLYTRKGDNKGATATYRKVAGRYGDQGFFLKAVAVYKQILKLEANDLPAIEGLAEMYEKLSLTSDATATYEQVADAYLHLGKSDKALRALGKLTELDSNNVAGFVRYAEALSKANRIDEAAEAFSKAADLLQRAGRIDDYIKVSERLLFHSHENIDRARDLAAIYIERGQAKAALAHLQTCFKADAKSVATLELLARAFRALGQEPKAASVYKEIARVHAAEGRGAEEADALRALLEIEPTDADARHRLSALASDQLEEVDGEAVQVIEDEEFDDVVIVDEEPAASAAAPLATPISEGDRKQQIARLMAECDVFLRYGLRDKVVTQLNRVLDLDPHHVEARERLKTAHLKRGEVDDAVTQLLILSEIVAAAEPARARGYLQEAAQLSPGNEAVAARLVELQAMESVPGAAADDEDELIIVDDEEDALVMDSGPAFDPHARPALGPRETSLATALEGSDDPELLLEEGEEEDEEYEPELEREQEEEQEEEREELADELPEEITDAIEEADFYLAQQLSDEAREVLIDCLGSNPNHPALLAKLHAIDELEAAAPAAAAPAPVRAPAVAAAAPQRAASPQRAPAPERKAEVEDRSFALAQKLASETQSGTQGPVDVEQVLKQFKEGVKRQVATSDTETHYDLGIAYMEMGLHAEAIEAFKLCLERPDKQCTAHTMIGLSYVSKGEMENAIVHFKLALISNGRAPEQELDLWFEIGNAYELLSKASDALVWYEKVEERDPNFRDLAARMQRLGYKKSAQQEVDEFDAMFDNLIVKE